MYDITTSNSISRFPRLDAVKPLPGDRAVQVGVPGEVYLGGTDRKWHRAPWCDGDRPDPLAIAAFRRRIGLSA